MQEQQGRDDYESLRFDRKLRGGIGNVLKGAGIWTVGCQKRRRVVEYPRGDFSYGCKVDRRTDRPPAAGTGPIPDGTAEQLLDAEGNPVEAAFEGAAEPLDGE